ncbi:hypothetical protein LUZ63_016297 [Rhynchospora breviuscula]|uniref:Ribosomal protein L34Ae n=1 Tax=Rhynchospora breviuscula TaxID=2022672 RepID=A0A9P9Z9N3_9POAL|nr:hypothetical protein LUZ63_016297 [Rhynchospora breviuscula]
MINGLMECCLINLQELRPQSNRTEVISSFSSHGHGQYLCRDGTSVMFELHVFSHVSFILLLSHLIFFLLVKLFGYLHDRAAFSDQNRVDQTKTNKRNNKKYVHWADEKITIREKYFFDNAVAKEEEGILYWLSEAQFSKDSLLGYEEREESTEKPCLELENSFVAESSCIFPPQNLGTESEADHLLTENLSLSDCDPSPIVSSSESNVPTGNRPDLGDSHQQIEHLEISDEGKIHVTDTLIQIENGAVNQEIEDSNNNLFSGESTSKSSVEWRSSTITKDSETEYPFSSSSRKSSSRWESYTVFRKYDEEMLYFHRISAEKLTETESFRSITYQPRSISERIYHKLTMKHTGTPDEIRNPYRELENAYVAQVCLAWEVLNWNYRNFFRQNPDPKEMGKLYCSARVAQEFQQFQVLLQRFIENEPYEFGRRPEVYARMKVNSPKLLLVPEFTDLDDDKEAQISAIEFLLILKDIIRTFLNFIKADKQTRCQKIKSLMKKKSATVDLNTVNFLKKTNNKKKIRLKDLVRQRRCFIQRKLVKVEDEMEIIMGLIDLKVVSRVLRMPNITQEQLEWCEQKMSKVRVFEGKIQRDSSPLVFPVH